MTACDSRQLAFLNEAYQALEAASTLQEIKSVRDKAEAVRQYARSASLGLEVQNSAAEVKLRAERKAGQLLGELHLRGGDRRSDGHATGLKLSHLGVSQSQSARWQQQAAVPEATFENYVKTARQEGAEITTRGLLKLTRGPKAPRAACRRKPMFVADSPSQANDAGAAAAASLTYQVGDAPDECRHLESLREVINHCRLLSGILEENRAKVNATPLRQERRVVRRLVTEIERLTGQMVDDIERFR